jgi:hypothetical protein
MRLVRDVLLAAAVCAAVCAAVACKATHSSEKEDIKFSGFLSSYDGVAATNNSEKAAYRWEKPGLSLQGYHSVLFDRPVAQMTRQALTEVGEKDMSYVLGLTDKRFRETLGKRYTLTETAGPGVLRVRTALSDLNPSTAVMTFGRILPIGIVVSKGKELATGTAINVGKVGGELEIVDSVSGERLAAAVDRRVGHGVARNVFTYWGDVDDAVITWSEKLSDNLHTWGLPMTVQGAK